MNDKQLSIFLAVAASTSINEAAKKAFASPQSVTYQLNVLESELGYPLFERTTQGVLLTADGRAFKEDAERVLQILESARRRGSASGRRGEVLRVSVRSDAGSMILASVCERFAELHPETEIRLVPLTTGEQFRDIRSGLFDLTESPDSAQARARGLGFTKIVSSPNVCMLKTGDPLAARGSIALDDLVGRNVCMQDAAKCYAAGQLRDRIREHNRPVNLVDMDYNAAQASLAALGDVVVIAPLVFARHNVDATVWSCVPLEDDIPVDIGIVWAGQRPIPVVQKFIDTALEMADELVGDAR